MNTVVLILAVDVVVIFITGLSGPLVVGESGFFVVVVVVKAVMLMFFLFIVDNKVVSNGDNELFSLNDICTELE